MAALQSIQGHLYLHWTSLYEKDSYMDEGQIGSQSERVSITAEA